MARTVAHALKAWPQTELRLYVGCYRNDQQTIAAVLASIGQDNRVRLVIHDKAGPTTKADCLNRLYQALQTDERRTGERSRMIVLHDAEDMVDPAGLGLLDHSMESADMAQLPVLPQPQRSSQWIGSHYCEEFVEAHGKAMVVRDALRAGMPLAGVGCAIGRDALQCIADSKENGQPFAAECLTEDYELGLGVYEQGGAARFLRYRHDNGALVATRAYFPSRLDAAVRQKTRWVHGIAFQAWDRLGWQGRPVEIWMRLRDRRGPLAALVLAVAYALLVLSTLAWGLAALGFGEPIQLSDTLVLILWLNFASFVWRGAWRFGFTAREYGWSEGIRSILRIPVTNIIAIMAGRRAIMAYLRSLGGQQPAWDKTDHQTHPVHTIAHERAEAVA